MTISSWTYRRISERDTYRTIGLISDNRSHTYDRHIGRSSTRTGTSSAYNTSNDRYASYDWTRYTTASYNQSSSGRATRPIVSRHLTYLTTGHNRKRYTTRSIPPDLILQCYDTRVPCKRTCTC